MGDKILMIVVEVQYRVREREYGWIVGESGVKREHFFGLKTVKGGSSLLLLLSVLKKRERGGEGEEEEMGEGQVFIVLEVGCWVRVQRRQTGALQTQET